MSSSSSDRVLVTGATGFIAMHCIVELARAGFRIRGTLRDPSRAPSLRAALAPHLPEGTDVELVAAELGADPGWHDAVDGCRFVLHVASPLPKALPRHEEDLVVPAREGTLRVLEASIEADVERVVITSSLAAVSSGHPRDRTRPFDESDWSVVENLAPYEKSKTLAERAAWERVRAQPAGRGLELVTIQPGLVLGPLLSPDASASLEAVRKLLARELPALPRLGYSLVDVRDVAAAHVAALTTREAAGQRFCCANGFAWMADIARILHEELGPRGFRIPRATVPSPVVRLFALFDPTTRMILPQLGRRTEVSCERLRTVLGWEPRGHREMVVASAETLIAHGVVTVPR